MGSAAGSSEQLEGHIEVACTAHASTGVRRLVKSVVRGLKVNRKLTAAGSSDSSSCSEKSALAIFSASSICSQHIKRQTYSNM